MGLATAGIKSLIAQKSALVLGACVKETILLTRYSQAIVGNGLDRSVTHLDLRRRGRENRPLDTRVDFWPIGDLMPAVAKPVTEWYNYEALLYMTL